MQEAYQQQLKETVPTPPNVTFDDHMTIFRGDREIRLIHPGRGHSDTDVLVYLPKEKVIMTGDFFEGPVTGALNFGFHDEWANNLEKLKVFDYETDDRRPRRAVQGQGAHRLLPGVPARPVEPDEDAARSEGAGGRRGQAHRPDRRTSRTTSNINGPGFQEATIARIYQVLDQRAGSN